MIPAAADSGIWEKMQKLASCLCAAAQDSELDDLCSCSVQPGQTVAFDFISEGCEDADGMAWVRLTTAYASQNYPQPFVALNNCATSQAFVCEVGIVRTIQIPEDGEPLDAAGWQAATERQIREMDLMRYAINCCYGNSAVLGQYQPVGPQGAAVGGFWTVTLSALDYDEDWD